MGMAIPAPVSTPLDGRVSQAEQTYPCRWTRDEPVLPDGLVGFFGQPFLSTMSPYHIHAVADFGELGRLATSEDGSVYRQAWWGRGDSNSHAAMAHDPKSCASAVPPLPHDVYRIASPTGDAAGGDGGGGAGRASLREAQDAPRRTRQLLRRLNARPAWPAMSQAASAAGRRARAAP